MNARRGDIRKYIDGCSALKNRYQVVSSDAVREQDFISQVALSGYFDGATRYESIYSIGDILSSVQIMTSLCADNKTDPADPAMSSAWEPFFKTNSEQKLSGEIMDYLSAAFDRALVNHLSVCHLMSDGGMLLADAVSAEYLDASLDNIPGSARQWFGSHLYRNGDDREMLKGFDSVKTFVRRTFADGLVKWFRLWESGYLEHGGIIDAQRPDITEDQTAYDGDCVRVNLNWSYAGLSAAPCYDFPRTGLEPFYKKDSVIDMTGVPRQYQVDGNVYISGRYTVKTSDIRSSSYPVSPAGSRFAGSGCYLTNEVNTMNNDSFCALRNSGTERISYYCSGFTYSNSKRTY